MAAVAYATLRSEKEGTSAAELARVCLAGAPR